MAVCRAIERRHLADSGHPPDGGGALLVSVEDNRGLALGTPPSEGNWRLGMEESTADLENYFFVNSEILGILIWQKKTRKL